jgi:uncharacterized membrane protein YcaP (DUF421 family)
VDKIFGFDWQKAFIPTTSILEIVIRGSIMYLSIFFLLRFILRREAGTVGITDLLVVVLIADAAQNGMASDYTSITEGLILVATIVLWSFFLDWLGFHFPAIQDLLHPRPLLLVKDGRADKRNLRKELITDEELMGQLREQGVDGLDKVKKAYMEQDGRISVITNSSNDEEKAKGTPERKGD